ncbi:MAG: YggU family protein [Nitratiruptor sp.]|nr:YggU family protein [Nitratiruptor sp.]NPA83754.1 YggU family protein [Campylobacterota bacterium]
MWYEWDGEWCSLLLKIQPSASRNRIAGLWDGRLKVNLAAPAVEGAANRELVHFLSKLFRVPKGEIEIVAGERSKLKRVRLPRSQKLEAFIKEMDARERLQGSS